MEKGNQPYFALLQAPETFSAGPEGRREKMGNIMLMKVFMRSTN